MSNFLRPTGPNSFTVFVNDFPVATVERLPYPATWQATESEPYCSEPYVLCDADLITLARKVRDAEEAIQREHYLELQAEIEAEYAWLRYAENIGYDTDGIYR